MRAEAGQRERKGDEEVYWDRDEDLALRGHGVGREEGESVSR